MESGPITLIKECNVQENVSGLSFIKELRPATIKAAAKRVGYSFSEVDKSGTLWGVRYAEFVVPLVKEMQEQQLQITDYKLQIANLEAAGNNQQVAIESLQKQQIASNR